MIDPFTATILPIAAAALVAGGGAFLALTLLAEGEPGGARRAALGTGVVLILLVFLDLAVPTPYNTIIFGLLLLAIALTSAFLFLPVGAITSSSLPQGDSHYNRASIDERDTMFARMSYMPGSTQYDDYYRERPDKKRVDDALRELPGLLQPGSRAYDPGSFPMAESAFKFLSDINHLASGGHNPKAGDDPSLEPAARQPLTPSRATGFLKGLARHYGATLVGVTDLEPFHLYTRLGRRPEVYGQEVDLKHTQAIALAVEMDFDMVRRAPYGSAVVESSHQYVESAKIALVLAYYIRSLGYDARAHIDANYQVIAPLVAASAGLGEIGRMGILITRPYGPRVRLAVVTTDLPLVSDEPISFGVQDFCRICKKCSDNCPSEAIPSGDREPINGGLPRWQIGQEKCFGFWQRVGTDCAICMKVCPYSKPDTLIHRPIRYAIERSQAARWVALKADDLFYGRRPALDATLPIWLDER